MLSLVRGTNALLFIGKVEIVTDAMVGSAGCREGRGSP